MLNLNDYIALFPGFSRDKPRFIAMVQAFLQQAVDLSAVVDSIVPSFSFETAEGAQLDMIAKAIGLRRTDMSAEAMSDADFRAYIYSKITLWTWDGTNTTTRDIMEREGSAATRMTDNLDGSVTLNIADNVDPAYMTYPMPAGMTLNYTE